MDAIVLREELGQRVQESLMVENDFDTFTSLVVIRGRCIKASR